MRLTHFVFALASLAIAAKPVSKKPKAPERQAHVVLRGETAAAIGRKFGLSLAELKALNPGKDLSRLAVGSRVVLAKGRLGPTAVSSASAPLVPVTPLPRLPGLRARSLANLERLLPAPTRSEPSSEGQAEAVSSSPERFKQDLNPVPLPNAQSAIDSEEDEANIRPADPDRLDLLWPVETRTVSSAWGPRTRVRTVRVKNHQKKRVRYKGRHQGVDLTAPLGTDVFAALDGQVVTAGRHRQYGNYLVVDHGNGVATLYAHHRLNLVQEGDIVRRGQKIAEVGRTGNATGPHLHFELMLNGLRTNPLPYLNDEEEILDDLQAMRTTATP